MIGIVTMSFVCTGNSFAQDFIVDKEGSSVIFLVEHEIGFNFGHIKDFDGTIKLSKDQSGIEDIMVNCDMATINTFNELRDELMHSEKFFNVEAHPQAKLKTKKISKDKFTAEVTIKGITKKVEFEYQFWGIAKDEKNKQKVAVTFVGHIQRKDFGIDYNPKLEDGRELLGEEIEIMMDLTAIEK